MPQRVQMRSLLGTQEMVTIRASRRSTARRGNFLQVDHSLQRQWQQLPHLCSLAMALHVMPLVDTARAATSPVLRSLLPRFSPPSMVQQHNAVQSMQNACMHRCRHCSQSRLQRR